jgi:DNA-binding transcriptional regulator LsrR (DeoR family)
VLHVYGIELYLFCFLADGQVDISGFATIGRNRRVIGVTLEQLRGVDRCVGIAGGERKFEAIRGALKGGWINVLITDRTTAERLLGDPA